MKRTIWKYGLISGGISSFWLLLMPFAGENCGSDLSMIIGYATMLVGFVVIYFGTRHIRNQSANGEMTFGQAFITGLYIAIVASTVYVLTWLIMYYAFIPDYFDRMARSYAGNLADKGASQEQIDRQIAQAAQMKEWYKNPLVNIAMTYSEILPVGMFVSLICAALLKRKPSQDIK
jgi:hypothetical protein